MFSPVVKHLSSKSCLMAHYVLCGSFRGALMDWVMSTDIGREGRIFDGRLCRNCLHRDGERRRGAASCQQLPQDAQLPGSLCPAKGLLPFTSPHSPGTVSDCPWLTAFPARCCQSTHFADLTVGKLCLNASFAFPVFLRSVIVVLPLPLCHLLVFLLAWVHFFH